MWKLFSRSKTVEENQQRLFFALGRLVSVAKVKIEREDNEAVKEILDDLENTFRKFWQLKIENPEKFNSLLWSKDFYRDYVVPLEGKAGPLKESSQATKDMEQLKMDAALRLSFRAERELQGLTQFLNSFEKIWKCALRNDNDEVSRSVVYHLYWLLEELTRKPENHLFVTEFLNLITNLATEAIENPKSNNKIDTSVFSAAIDWYTGIVFSRQRVEVGSFDLSYLEQFDKYFFSMIKYIISKEQTSIFYHLLSSLVDGIIVQDESKLWEYQQLIQLSNPQMYGKIEAEHQVSKRINELSASQNHLYTRKELEQWITKFDELVEISKSYFNINQKDQASKLERETKEAAISKFKYNNLLEIVASIGAYCIFKNNPEFIKYLWEYKQPLDSDAAWIGHDIVPNGLNDVVIQHFRIDQLERKFDFWEGHHGTAKYYKQYFLLLLVRALQNMAPNSIGKYDSIEKYDLPKVAINSLSNIIQSIDELVSLAGEMKKNSQFLCALRFNEDKIDELFENRLMPFLKILKEKAEKRISDEEKTRNISQRKVDEFKKSVSDTFNELVMLRRIFMHYKLYEDNTAKKDCSKLELFGISRVDPKAAFFEEWHISYYDWGKSLGRGLAFGEDSFLIEAIAKNCTEISEGRFAEKLEDFEDSSKIIILATNMTLYKFFGPSRNFKSKRLENAQQLDVKGFAGWYQLGEKSIPVFEVFQGGKSNNILILDTSKLGRLIQYSPLKEGEEEKLLITSWYMNVKAFSEDQNLMNKFIENPPEWLQKVGNEKEQKDHLQKLVLVRIFERFAYEKSEDFRGYLVRNKVEQ